MLAHVRAFTYARQRLGRAAPDAATALSDVLAVYSSHPSAPLALAARSARMSAEDFRTLAAASVRLSVMRGAVHLMAPHAAARAFAALPEPAAARAARLRTFGLSEERYAALRAALLDAAREPRTQLELTAALSASDAATTPGPGAAPAGSDAVAAGPAPATASEVKGATAVMARAGELVRVGAPGLRSNALRYVAWEHPAHERDAALAWLAGEYLRTLGPARLADLTWWLGVPKGRAATALAEHDTVELAPGLLLLAQDAAAFERAPAPRGVDLLGKWDPLQMGHAPDGRARCGFVPETYDHRGDGVPTVLADGVAIATWSLTAKGKALAFELTPFERPGAKLRAAIDARAEELAALLA